MTRWPGRKQPDPGIPGPLREFNEADWQEWLLDGPDPAADAYAVPLEEWYAPPHPVEVEVFRGTGLPMTTRMEMVGIGDRPELVAVWRRVDAHKRWSHARIEWLKARGLPWLATWIDDVRAEHQLRVRG